MKVAGRKMRCVISTPGKTAPVESFTVPLICAVDCAQAQVAAMSEEHRREVAKGVPIGRFGRSEEAAHAVLYLASDNAGYVTGETLNLSGGRFMD